MSRRCSCEELNVFATSQTQKGVGFENLKKEEKLIDPEHEAGHEADETVN